VNKVWLPAGAGLAFMMFQRIIVGFFNDGEIILGTILLHRFIRSRNFGARSKKLWSANLLAQARHVGFISAKSPCRNGTSCLASFSFERRCPILAFFARSGLLLSDAGNTFFVAQKPAHA